MDGRTTGRECSVYGVEGYVVHCVYESLVFRVGDVVAAVAFEGKVIPEI